MAEITAKMVKSFRDKTGLPMMECKKALQQAEGNEELAIELIRKAGKKTMAKRSDRETEAGRVAIYKAPNGATAMVELLCESAPVANTAEFIRLINNIAKQLAEGPGAATPEELLAQSDLQLQFDDLMNKIREVFKLRRILRVEGSAGTYVHHDNSNGVVLEFEGSGEPQVADNICMHIVAMNPKALRPEDLPAEVLAKEREIVVEQTRNQNSNKPANIIEKIVDGRMKSVLAEICCVDQPFVMDADKTVEQAATEGGIQLKKMYHWIVGK